LHALLGFDATGEVTLRQVRQFVSQYRGVFAFGLGVEEQPAVDPDNAAGAAKALSCGLLIRMNSRRRSLTWLVSTSLYTLDST
jgi:hypothetical protein